MLAAIITVLGAVLAALAGVQPAAAAAGQAAARSAKPWPAARLEQALAQLGYLPLGWEQPAGGGAPGGMAVHLRTAGAFAWRAAYPASLTRLWKPGQPNVILNGAIMSFEADHGLAINAAAGPAVRAELSRALAKGQRNRHGYTYAVATKSGKERLTVWHDGKEIVRTLANTGIAASPTVNGTFPVYERLRFQIMQGVNPDGSAYADPVWWVAYFHGGDAIHYYPRASYGWPQSLGCVEIPWSPAKKAWPYLTDGTLVTVRG